MASIRAFRPIIQAYSILFNEIEHSNDLVKYGLTVSDYYTARNCLVGLQTAGNRADCISSSVAEFFRKLGFSVAERGIGFRIALQDVSK